MFDEFNPVRANPWQMMSMVSFDYKVKIPDHAPLFLAMETGPILPAWCIVIENEF